MRSMHDKFLKIRSGSIALFAVVMLNACSIAPSGVDIHDPFEKSNRQVHALNKAIDAKLFAGGGADDGPMIPPAVGDRVVDFADNLGQPGRVLNDLLQLDVEGVVTNALRFVVNTTVGIGGLFDPADALGIEEMDTDFGETLAVWGVDEGAYLELPLLGPTTQRRLAGRVVDMFIDPLGGVGTGDQRLAARVAKIGARVIKRDQVGDTVDSVLNESADSYAQLRLIYLQNRRFDLGQDASEDAVDPYDELFGDTP